MSNITALPVAEPATQNPLATLAPKTLDEALRFAEMLSKSDLVPKDYQNKPGNCLIAIQWGMEIGLQPLQAMQNIACINGRPSLWGDSMLALCRAHPSFEWIDEKEGADGAVVTVKRRGQPECVREFNLEDAKRSGLLGKQGPWQQSPKRMMKLRARAFALRDTFTDVLRGIASAEEMRDMPTPAERDMGSAEVVDRPAATTKTDALKSRLGAGKKAAPQPQPQPPAVTVDQVLAAISAAHDRETMAAAKALGEKLPDGPDKDRAVAAYSERVAALKAAAAQPQTDTQTGEIADPQDDFLAGYDAASEGDK